MRSERVPRSACKAMGMEMAMATAAQKTLQQVGRAAQKTKTPSHREAACACGALPETVLLGRPTSCMCASALPASFMMKEGLLDILDTPTSYVWAHAHVQ